MLPELLRINYLEDCALSLVKNIHNIDKIWKRLKRHIETQRLCPEKELTELENLEPI